MNKPDQSLRRFSMLHRMNSISFLLLSFSLLPISGCGAPSGGGTPPPEKPTKRSNTPAARGGDAAGGEHGHKPGAHGGLIVEIGRDNYHAEAIFATGGTLRIHLLAADESRIQEVELQTLTGYARPVDGGEALSFSLEPDPQPGDAKEKTSAFVGTLPEPLRGIVVEVTIPSIRIDGERFRFSVTMPAVHHEPDMPRKASDAEEAALYLTPGGIYTAADIEANGNTTAAAKFKGIASTHNMQTQSGDRVCPITMTKANPKFTWIVGGKAYQFCCPPCVDEFVKTAKEEPEKIKFPAEYVKP
jgi:hypothetical protein